MISRLFGRLMGAFNTDVRPVPKTLAAALAGEDARLAAQGTGRRFSAGTRPVIRWIKGDGQDDPVTKAAIGQATRLFGAEVDYCLCTHGISAGRARDILEWAEQPVEWWPLTGRENPELAKFLTDAGCPPEQYGYWWKWFPERVRPDAPEWILDGDMVITAKPPWFGDWLQGKDGLRVAQDDLWPAEGMYGKYVPHVNLSLRLYSGLTSLPPGLRYMDRVAEVLAAQPLNHLHDGRRDMCEQGVIAAALQKLAAQPIPLYEFPFGRAFEDHLDYGLRGDQGKAWGYHFGCAFRGPNRHFERLTAEGAVFSKKESSVPERVRWLSGGTGQWGIPGWGASERFAQAVMEHAGAFAGKPVLELGTSRGRITAVLAAAGCHVTTVDPQDRGAAQNLEGLAVRCVQDDGLHFLTSTEGSYDLIVVDVHGNSQPEWERLAGPLLRRLRCRGMLIVDNATLHEIPEWREENGVAWFLRHLPWGWTAKLHDREIPGVAVIRRPFF